MRLVNSKKFYFWSAVASILGFPLTILGLYWAVQPPTASSQSQPRPPVSTTGAQSPAIGSNEGSVTFYYNNQNKEKGYVLRNVKAGVTLVERFVSS
jgi:hypothetical protein